MSVESTGWYRDGLIDFGEGSESGLDEIARVLRPGGVFIAIDNDRRQHRGLASGAGGD